VTLLNFDVRFTPESGHSLGRQACPLCAISGLTHHNRTVKQVADLPGRDTVPYIAAGMIPLGTGQMAIDIGRRKLIAGLGSAAVASPLSVRAQQSDRVRRIGVLNSLAETDLDAQAWDAAFRKRLDELGWIDGRNIHIDYRWGPGSVERLQLFAKELVRLNPDVLVAVTTPATAALQQETHTIPIVFAFVSDPIGSGFVKSLAHPGGNATGWTPYTPALGGKWLEILKEIAPRVRRVGILFNPTTAPYVTGYYLPDLKAAAAAFAVEPIITVVHETAEFEDAISEVARERDGGLIAIPDTFLFVHRMPFIALANKYRVPAIYPWQHVCREGGLITYSPDLVEPFPRVAEYIDRILKGANFADLPVQAPTKYELAINLQTARALGIEVPPGLLAIADEVIE
jgi:putative tryptophan/tyrosine transport system substrate-binding protein